MHQRLTLSWFQAIEIGSASFLPLMFWFFPRIAVQTAGTDALWAVVAVLMVGVAVALLIGLLNERFPNMTGADVAKLVWTPWLGAPALVLYFAVYSMFTSMSLYFFVAVIRQFLPNTPMLVLMSSLALVSFSGAWYGVEALARVAAVVHPMTWLGLGAIFTTAVLQIHEFGIVTKPVSIGQIMNGTYHLLPLFLGINYIRMIAPFYKHIRGSLWYPVASSAVGSIAVLLTFVVTVMILGDAATAHLTFTLPFVLRLITLHGWLIERVGIFVIIFATAFTTLFISNHFWALSSLAAHIVGLTEDVHRDFVPAIAVMILAEAMWFQNEDMAFQLLDKFMVPASWVTLIIIPLAVYLTAVFRGMRTFPLKAWSEQAREHHP